MLFSTKAGVHCFMEFVLSRQGVSLSSFWPTPRYRAELIAVDRIVRTLLLADIARCLPHKAARTTVVATTTATVTTTETPLTAAGNIDTTEGHLTAELTVLQVTIWPSIRRRASGSNKSSVWWCSFRKLPPRCKPCTIDPRLLLTATPNSVNP